MSLLMFMSSTDGGTVRPRESSLTAPYNASRYLDMPAVYPAPSGTHPSVHDFGKPWNGWRYWMAYTPYYNAKDQEENPVIVVSNDKATWVEPAGISNPLAPAPSISGFNSDTDLAWDGERLWVIWREYLNASGDLTYYANSSTDGVNWTPRQEVLKPEASTPRLSPAILPNPFGDGWMMWTIGNNGADHGGLRTAPTPTGTWSTHTPLAFDWSKADKTYAPWHVDVIHDEGQYRMILNASNTLVPGVSEDGINWRMGSAVLTPKATWEGSMYRATMVPAGNGADYDVWYGITGSGWQICYTQIPARHWRTL